MQEVVRTREELVRVYVSRIEITGFKSFVDRTVIELERGISAIVGPNGCGKTNICDAIRWVLGEENVRLLRGTRIDDIIFNGTEKRKPTGMAEVSLTLSDVQDTLPLDCNEVTITRRVFRSGDSQFFINKVPSRLKDIVNLLLGTGLGRRAYSIMERDMIDWILDDANGQRRRIIEEAAGISKYKVRRQETMNKLALTERDLERVEDLITEVERRVRSLARQAAKARRYERLVNRIREVETYASVKAYRGMRERLDAVKSEISDLETKLAFQAKQIALAESEIENKRGGLTEIEREITKYGEEISRITEQIQKLENERVLASERNHTIGEKIAELTDEKQQRSETIASKRNLFAQKQKEIEEVRRQIEQLEKERQDLATRFEKTSSELKQKREHSVASTKSRLANVQQQIDA
ncbi:MAG TPA: chromosome segregation protein SMC, partial [Firmicutes bacterium]|nr:chromosome segregation protein SMC [Bacillota bacterium]